jgi:hypothetical protein
VVSLIGAILLLTQVMPAAAQSASPDTCPLAADDTASRAIGDTVQGHADPDMPDGFVFCDFVDTSGTDYGVSRQSGAFDAGAVVTPSALARIFIPKLPEATRLTIDALQQPGLRVALPGYEVATIGGLGDSAIWVKSELLPGVFTDSLLVQRGTDAFAFDVDDSAEAQIVLIALAREVLANISP